MCRLVCMLTTEQVPRKLEPWPETYARRASINNFGYGGANAHVIMEAWQPQIMSTANVRIGTTLFGSQGHLSDVSTTPSSVGPDENFFDQEDSTSRDISTSTSSIASVPPALDRRVLLLTAKDEAVTKAMVSRLEDYVRDSGLSDEELIDRLAHTLGLRRSRFPWRIVFSFPTTRAGLVSKLRDTTVLAPVRTTKPPRLGFVFTGQGAQWYAMGRELIEVYPVFAATIQEADKYLRDMNSSWSLIGEPRIVRTPLAPLITTS
jgi:acyl transferase domain-containing protein